MSDDTTTDEALTDAPRDRNQIHDETDRRYRALWDPPPPPTTGRPARIHRDQIVDAAVALADADGLAAVSMRALGRRLGVAAMTLYSHVGSQRELLDAMVDRAYGDFTLPDPDLGWRDALEQYARELWTVLRRHPWLLEINTWRLPLGPHVLDVEEAGYRALIDTGLSANQVAETIGIVRNVVTGHARSAATEEAEAEREGIDYEAHWRATTDFWERYYDPRRYPNMTRLWSAGAFDEDATPFEVPLAGLLDTIGLLIDRARAAGPAVIPAFEECMARYEDDPACPAEDPPPE